MAGFGPAVVESMPELPPLECGPSPSVSCALQAVASPFPPDTDMHSVFSGIRKSVCKRDRWSW
jgi:hypothetical protein